MSSSLADINPDLHGAAGHRDNPVCISLFGATIAKTVGVTVSAIEKPFFVALY